MSISTLGRPMSVRCFPASQVRSLGCSMVATSAGSGLSVSFSLRTPGAAQLQSSIPSTTISKTMHLFLEMPLPPLHPSLQRRGKTDDKGKDPGSPITNVGDDRREKVPVLTKEGNQERRDTFFLPFVRGRPGGVDSEFATPPRQQAEHGLHGHVSRIVRSRRLRPELAAEDARATPPCRHVDLTRRRNKTG